MVIYEVNLHVDPEIAEAYGAWLGPHIEEVLEVEGFERAAWFEVERDDGRVHWTVQYMLETREQLQAYFDEHAERLRGDAMERFAGGFEADRRILALKQVVA